MQKFDLDNPDFQGILYNPEDEDEEDISTNPLDIYNFKGSPDFYLWTTHTDYEHVFWALWSFVSVDGTSGRISLPDNMTTTLLLDLAQKKGTTTLEIFQNFGLVWQSCSSVFNHRKK